MLVLNRKKDESIMIGNLIEVKVLKTGKNFVEIGINAPKDLSIFRKELFTAVKNKNIEASKSIGTEDIDSLKKLLGSIKS